MRRLIMFLIRRKLGVKKFEYFMFTNQKSDDIYYIDSNNLMKISSRDTYGKESYIDHPIYEGRHAKYSRSTASLNWLMSDGCKIKTIPGRREEVVR